MALLAEHRPADIVLSEEGKDDRRRLDADRVWIVDPLDGTREFSEPPRDDWAVHVALWERGADDLTAGAVAQPALGRTFTHRRAARRTRRARPARPRIAVSRSRPPEFVHGLAARARRRAGADGLGGLQGHLGGPRRHRRLRPRRRPVRVGLGRAGRGRPRGRAVHLAHRRLAAALQPGRRLPARPDRVPAGAGRARSLAYVDDARRTTSRLARHD